MAQTTNAIPKSPFKLEVSLNGTVWTDISGVATKVTPGGGDQQIGTQFTADGGVPLVTNSNKLEAVTLQADIVYTEQSGEAFQVVYGQYAGADKRIYMRYAPKGGASGNKRYVCANDAGTAIPVPIQSCLPPEVEAGDGAPVAASFSVMAPRLIQETIA